MNLAAVLQLEAAFGNNAGHVSRSSALGYRTVLQKKSDDA
jgi:hypothetical protein